MGNKDKNLARVWREIYDIFMDVWDPIGVGRTEGALDEYDSYIGGIYKLLINHASEKEIYEYLFDLEKNHMGLSSAGSTTKLTVDKLLKIKLTAD